MNESGYYPLGAEFDNNAPWNVTPLTDEEYQKYLDDKAEYYERFYDRD